MDSVDPNAIIGTTLVDPTGHHAVVITQLIGSGSFAHVYLAEEEVSHPGLSSPSSLSSSSSSSGKRHPHNHSHQHGVDDLHNPQRPQPLAATTSTERRAVKRLFKAGLDERQLALQRQEAEVMKAIDPHLNIIRLLATVEDEECLYLIMEYCELDLYEAITQQGGFPDDVVKEVFGQIADAVLHCHAAGIYHRDLKPENCLISAEYKVKLADFGLATSDRWSTEMGCGSVRYMAPECFDPLHNAAENQAPLTPPPEVVGYSPPANDVWALGVILVNLLFGKNPWFEAHKTDAIFRAYCTHNPNILRQQFNLSPQFDAVLRRAFELDPSRRCSVADLKQMVEATAAFVGTPPPAPPPTPPFFTYSKDSILTGPGLVVPVGLTVRLPVDMKRFSLAGSRTSGKRKSKRHSTRSQVAAQSMVEEVKPAPATPTKQLTPPQEDQQLVSPLRHSNIPPLSASFSFEDEIDNLDEERERMSTGMAEKMFDSDTEHIDDVETSTEVADSDVAAEPQNQTDFDDHVEDGVGRGDSSELNGIEQQAESGQSTAQTEDSTEAAAASAASAPAPMSDSAAVASDSPPTPAPGSVVTARASRSRDSGFESAVGTPARNLVAPVGVHTSSTPRPLLKAVPESTSDEAAEPLTGVAGVSVGASSESHSEKTDASKATADAAVQTATLRRVSHYTVSEGTPNSLPRQLLYGSEKASTDIDNASLELPVANRRIFRASKLFRLGKARQQSRENGESSPRDTSSDLPRPPKATRNPSPKGWFVQMVRESPGRPSASGGESRGTGIIGVLGLRRKPSTPSSSLELTPDSSPAPIDRSLFRRPSWRAASPFTKRGRATPAPSDRRGSESSGEGGGGSRSSQSDGSSSSTDDSQRERPLGRLRTALSVSSLKKAWQTIRVKTGLGSPTTATPPQAPAASSSSTSSQRDGFPRHLPPRPASANDIHVALPPSPTSPAAPRRPAGWRRPGGRELLSGELFTPSPLAFAASTPLSHSPSPPPPPAPLFAELAGSDGGDGSGGASGPAGSSSETLVVDGETVRRKDVKLAVDVAAAAMEKRRKHRSMSAPPVF